MEAVVSADRNPRARKASEWGHCIVKTRLGGHEGPTLGSDRPRRERAPGTF